MSSEHYEQLGRATDAVQKAQKRSSAAQEHLLEFQAQMEAFRNVNFRMLRVEGGRPQPADSGRTWSKRTDSRGRALADLRRTDGSGGGARRGVARVAGSEGSL